MTFTERRRLLIQIRELKKAVAMLWEIPAYAEYRRNLLANIGELRYRLK